MTNVSKLRICETFGLIELHNLSKVHLADRIFYYEKAVFTITGPVNIQLLKLWLFKFSNFQTTFVENLMKKLPVFNEVPFEYKIKSWKICPFLGLFFRKADILNFSWIKYFGNDFSFLIKWHTWVCYCWNYGLSNLKAELKADLISNWYIF